MKFASLPRGLMIFAVAILSGCEGSQIDGASGEKTDPKLHCAALISASTQNLLLGKIDKDPAFERQALLSMTTYVNSYAIPNGIGEKEAYDRVNAHRDNMLETGDPKKIFKEAKRCIARTPGM